MFPFKKFSFLWFVFSALFLLEDDGGAGSDGNADGGAGSDGSQDSSQNNSANNATPSPTPSAAEKELAELKERYKDVDPDDYRKMVQARAKEAESKKRAEMSVEEKLKDLESRIEQENTEKKRSEFNSNFNNALDSAINSKKIKFAEIGQGARGINERELIKSWIIDEYVRDDAEATAKGLAEGKLSYKDMPRLVEAAIDDLIKYRRQILAASVQNDAAPHSTPKDNGVDQKSKEQLPLSKSDRVASVAKDFRQALSSAASQL